MKVVVTERPETPRDCIFSERSTSGYYVCTLRPYIPEAGCSPKCICKSTSSCDRLITLEDI